MADLTTRAAVKTYLGIETTGADSRISALIPVESRQVERWTGRTYPGVTNTSKRLNGTGSAVLPLPDSPIISVSAVSIDGVAVAASPDGVAYGWIYEVGSAALIMRADVWPQGRLNVTVSWIAGYRTSETDFIPSGNTPTVTPVAGGTAVTPVSVADANSAAYVQVGNTPLTGQYSFASGVFTFNAANTGVSVTMTYDYVPGPIEQSVIEMVGLDLKQRDNLGVSSKSLAGETISYTSKGMTDSVKEMLWPFRRVAPV